jgi:hypothetical protein
MKEIAIAFVVSTAAALITGYLIDAKVASTAFGVVFPAVIAALAKREHEKDRMRAEQLRGELELSQQLKGKREGVQVPYQERSAPKQTYPTAEGELQALQQRASKPDIDWRPVVIGSIVALIILIPVFLILFPIAFILAIVNDLMFFLYIPISIAALILLVTGFWVAKKSTAAGILGPSVTGSIVGVSVSLVLLAFRGLDQDLPNIAWVLVLLTGSGVLLASIGGWIGDRQREQAAGVG